MVQGICPLNLWPLITGPSPNGVIQGPNQCR
ncbi:uncharacterized protein G2W53_008421 [Senna tora]|uniref:Uncharacterized protein n=1 Tax=Senna tora TaxID=362788 RepID=A0A835CF73_9FABA|nr:uncharacterized protein G2W53_008421 [Senna tora]